MHVVNDVLVENTGELRRRADGERHLLVIDCDLARLSHCGTRVAGSAARLFMYEGGISVVAVDGGEASGNVGIAA